MNLGMIRLVVLVLFLMGVFPRWPYSRNWDYGPTRVLGVILLVVLILSTRRMQM